MNITSTQTRIGTGRRNTQLIVDFFKINRESERAAQMCANLNIGGYTDWFLPSRDELNELYKQRNHLGIRSGWYWFSSQDGNRYAWGQNFNNGYQSPNNKNITGLVRAVRAF